VSTLRQRPQPASELVDEEQLLLAVKEQAIGELSFGFGFGERRE
jgi:hypothetical protein